MSVVILRRRRLGRTSCREIAALMPDTYVVRNWRDRFPSDTSYVFRWGCTSAIPADAVPINTADAIRWCTDKMQGRLDMQEAGVPVPQTWATDELERAFAIGDDMPEGRLVQRPAQHAQGRLLRVGTAHDLFDHDTQCQRLCS